MEGINNFDDLIKHLQQCGAKKRVAVVCPRDESTRQAVSRAEESGFVEPVFIDDEDLYVAAHKGVKLIRDGEADVLMKGLINSDILLRAVLDRDTGVLQPGAVLTHIAVASMKAYPKLLFYTDAAVIPYPTQEQRHSQIAYIAHICRSFGIQKPRISLVHCSEKVDQRHFPFTAGYYDLIEQSRKGDFGDCIVDGPLDVKTSCSRHSLETKGIKSPLEGEADALVFPDIEGANTFHKTLTLFCGARIACILQGAQCPIVLPSRSDDPDSKFYSLALAILMAERGGNATL